MADNLSEVLDFVERALGPLKRLNAGSAEAARAIKAAEESLRALNAQQAQVREFRTLKSELQSTAAKQALARDKVAALARAYSQAAAPTRSMTQELAKAKREAAMLSDQHDGQQVKVQELRSKLSAAGISTRDLANHSLRLRTGIAAANTTIEQQTAKLVTNGQQQRKLAELQESQENGVKNAEKIGAGGAAMMARGNQLAAPLRAVVGAYMQTEVAETQLRASMMTKTGEVGAEFQQILALATHLGGKLPGTTSEFIDMMTVLRRQGITSQAILGGLGESAAYLGTQLRMPVSAAAEFAAGMQSATQTSDKDMMGLMDVIQRTFHLGVDPANMLKGFTAVAAAMPYLGKQGLEASNMLAPMLVMFDQAGLKGEEAGNALRQVLSMSTNEGKLGKANDLLKGTGIQLDFQNPDGQFAGFDNLLAQLEKLKTIDNQVKRDAVMKLLSGNDAQTSQVLSTLMNKGLAGYREVVTNMETQADLRKRVDDQLQTVTFAAEGAQDSFSNALKGMGATIAPDLVLILNKLAEMANAVGEWAQENQSIVKWVLRVVGVLAIGAIALGALGLSIATVMGPMLVLRSVFAQLTLGSGLGMRAFALLSGGAGILRSALGRLLGFLSATPLGRAFALLTFSATMVYENWEGIKGGLTAIWEGVVDRVKGAMSGGISEWTAMLVNFSPLGILHDALGIEIPDRLSTLGSNMIAGLVNGLTAGATWVKDAVVGIASSAGDWFAEKLGDVKPLRLLMQLGSWISDGAAAGIKGGKAAMGTAALAMTSMAGATTPISADAAALRMDNRGPLMAQGAGAGVGAGALGAAGGAGASISITIHPAPGMDPQAIAQAVAAELDRRERAKRSSVLSQYSDIDG